MFSYFNLPSVGKQWKKLTSLFTLLTLNCTNKLKRTGSERERDRKKNQPYQNKTEKKQETKEKQEGKQTTSTLSKRPKQNKKSMGNQTSRHTHARLGMVRRRKKNLRPISGGCTIDAFGPVQMSSHSARAARRQSTSKVVFVKQHPACTTSPSLIARCRLCSLNCVFTQLIISKQDSQPSQIVN